MLERAVVVGVMVALVCVVGYLVRARTRGRSRALTGEALPVHLASQLGVSGPGILYFYGPHCATCRRQGAILDSLADQPGLAILRVDASSDTQVAGYFGILTVPATVVVDRSKRVQSINLGFRSADALRAQISTLSA